MLKSISLRESEKNLRGKYEKVWKMKSKNQNLVIAIYKQKIKIIRWWAHILETIKMSDVVFPTLIFELSL